MKTHILAAALVLAAAPAWAGQCGYQYCWGAVGIGPGGAWGAAHSFRSESAAINAVRTECGGDCTNIRTFYNTCGALAEGNSGNWGFGIGNTQVAAENNALNYCFQYGSGCGVRAWACSP